MKKIKEDILEVLNNEKNKKNLCEKILKIVLKNEDIFLLYDKEQYESILETLDFYADPDSYFGIGFIFDHPCGEFKNDFDKSYNNDDYDRNMAGKMAREALSKRNSVFLEHYEKTNNIETTKIMLQYYQAILQMTKVRTDLSVSEIATGIYNMSKESKQDYNVSVLHCISDILSKKQLSWE